MIQPAPTDKIDPTLARGTLLKVLPEMATHPEQVVITIPNTSYQLHLIAGSSLKSEVGKRIIGTIHLDARRVDVVQTGGKYVEPLYGRPRRVQGRVLSADEDARVIVVDAGMPIHCRLTDARQGVADFGVGTLVSFDAMDGARFVAEG